MYSIQNLTAQNCLCYGLSTLVTNLLYTDTGDNRVCRSTLCSAPECRCISSSIHSFGVHSFCSCRTPHGSSVIFLELLLILRVNTVCSYSLAVIPLSNLDAFSSRVCCHSRVLQVPAHLRCHTQQQFRWSDILRSAEGDCLTFVIGSVCSCNAVMFETFSVHTSARLCFPRLESFSSGFISLYP